MADVRVVGLRGSFWPARTQERILQAIFLDEARARAAWRDVRDELDLDVMEDGSYFLLPSLYRRLVELSIDDPDLPRLKGVYRRTWYRNTLLIDSMRAPLAELRASDVTLLILGAAAAGRSYSEHGLRWLEYVEAVVPTAELDRCRQALDGVRLRAPPRSPAAASAAADAVRRRCGQHPRRRWRAAARHAFAGPAVRERRRTVGSDGAGRARRRGRPRPRPDRRADARLPRRCHPSGRLEAGLGRRRDGGDRRRRRLGIDWERLSRRPRRHGSRFGSRRRWRI